MSVYLIALVTVKDQALETRLLSSLMEMIDRHEMELLTGPMSRVTVEEGTWAGNHVTMVRFPSRAHAEAFLADPVVVSLQEERATAGEATLLLVDGIA